MTEQDTRTSRQKVERARELLQDAHDELGHPDNSLLGPAIDQIDAHERRHWSPDTGIKQCPHGCGKMIHPVGDILEPAVPYCPECGHISGNDCDNGCNFEEKTGQ